MTIQSNVLEPGDSDFHAYPKSVKVAGGMRTLGDALQRLRSAGEPLPNDSQCPVCGYFDITHPDVRRILLDRDPTKRIFQQARCKCQSREEQQRRDEELRHAQAALPSGGTTRTFDNFLGRPGTDDMLAAARRFADRQGPRMLVLVGQTGTGKSHLLEAIGRQALESGRTVRYDLSPRFLNRLRHTYDSDSGDDLHDLMAWYQRRDTVLLDDIGMESTTDWAREQLTTLVQERHNSGGWMVLATNLNKTAMSDRMGDRLASRLYAGNPNLPEVAVVVNTAEDYRA
jgi:DNA replication protein DnaC